MTPKGNRTGKGHPPMVGGPSSKGSITKPIRFSIEMVDRIEKKIGDKKSFSDYVRECVEKDLSHET